MNFSFGKQQHYSVSTRIMKLQIIRLVHL